MKLININKIFFGLVSLLAMFSSCKKESESTYEIFKGLTIDFKQSIPSDEVYVEFDVKKTDSAKVISKITLAEAGSTTPIYTINVPYANRFGYSSGVLILKSANPSTASYTITVFDDKGAVINPITDNKLVISYPAGQLVASNPKLLTNKETPSVDEGANVYIDYSIHSEDADIKYIWLESFDNGLTTSSKINIKTLMEDVADKRNYRAVQRLKPYRNGGAKYRIYVTDGANDYIGDGYTSLHLNVNAGFELSANKFIYAPKLEATLANADLESACFYSIAKKKAYNYTEAKSISADIDFCFYITQSNNLYSLNLFSLSNATNPIADKFNFADWTKRATKFTPSISSVAQLNNAEPLSPSTVFNTNMISGTAIRQAVGAGRYASAITRTIANNIVVGSVMYLKTPEGKFGAIFINGFGKDYQGRYYTNIDLKVEK